MHATSGQRNALACNLRKVWTLTCRSGGAAAVRPPGAASRKGAVPLWDDSGHQAG